MLELRLTAAECASAFDAAPADAAQAPIELPAASTLKASSGEFGCGHRPRS